MRRKNFFVTLMMGAALIAGLASCNKDSDPVGGADDGATGALSISLAFEKSPATYAAQSSAIPTTSWANNIKSLAVFFVENGVIKNAQTVPYDNTKNDIADQPNRVINGIPAGTYDVYVFANWDQRSTIDWSIATAKGRNIVDLYMDAVKSTTYDSYKDYNATSNPNGSEANSVGYDEAPEVFVASKENVQIVADKTTDGNGVAKGENGYTPAIYKLTRIVSLVRVRINQLEDNTNNRNDAIDFQTSEASLRIRRIKTGINLTYDPTTVTDANAETMLLGTVRRNAIASLDDRVNPGITAKNTVFFAKGAFESMYPITGYNSNGTILSGNFKSWKDVMLIPAGSGRSDGSVLGDSKEKLDVVVTGITKDNMYVPAGYPKDTDGDGENDVLTAPQGVQIAWAGAVTATLKGNCILELNLTLRGAGTWVDPTDPDKPLPQPEEYGNLEITVGLADWNATIDNVDVDM